MMERECHRIIVVQPEQASSYREIRLRGLREHPEAFGETAATFAEKPLETIQTQIQSGFRGGGFILAALSEGGSILGVVGLTVTDAEKTRHRGLVWGMYVVPEARGQRIATRLIENLIHRAEQNEHLEQIHLAVVTTNVAAIRLYKTLGFTAYGTDPRVIRVGSLYFDEHLMVRGLRGLLISTGLVGESVK